MSLLENLMTGLPSIPDLHAPGTPVYGLLRKIAREEIERLFKNADEAPRPFEPFGTLALPYHSMGAVDSTNCLDFDELVLFSFYWANRGRYRRVLDIGANIGLHSILLDKCGYQVRAFEPDPEHFKILTRNLKLNHCLRVEAFQKAVSNAAGSRDFVRVLGNTTSSHIAGSKASPYGELETFAVQTEDVRALVAWADLVKLDAEGHEKEILLATQAGDWRQTEAIIEISNLENAKAVFEFFQSIRINLFSQKKSWKKVTALPDMPVSYKEGLLFVSSHDSMRWNDLGGSS